MATSIVNCAVQVGSRVDCLRLDVSGRSRDRIPRHRQVHGDNITRRKSAIATRPYGIRAEAAILAIGTSELFCADDPSSLNQFLSYLGAPAFVDGELERMANRAFAGELFQQ